MAEDTAEILGRFNAWRTASEAQSTSGATRSWKLVYEEALNSIYLLGHLVDLSSSTLSLVPRQRTENSATGSVTICEHKPVRAVTSASVMSRLAVGENVVGSVRSVTSSANAGASLSLVERPKGAKGLPECFPLALPLHEKPAETSVISAAGVEPRTSKRSRTTSGAKSADGRRTSLTIRMTVLEAASLKRNAAKAGATVSAYWRQCTLDLKNERSR